MTVDELLARESIRQTMARYNMAGDRLRLEEFAAVFTEDGIIESQGVREEDAFRYQGRQAIHDWMARWTREKNPDGSTTHRATFVRHHLSTCQIDLTGPDSAKTRTYWVAWTDIGPDHCGYYVDEFRKVGEEWLIAHRRIRLDWQSPDGLMTTAITRTR